VNHKQTGKLIGAFKNGCGQWGPWSQKDW